MKKNSVADGGLLNVDAEAVEVLDQEVIRDTQAVNKLVLKIVRPLSERLDGVVAEVREKLSQVASVDTESLEIYAMRISTELYYLGQAQEFVGLRADVSKVVYKERFNAFYQKAEGTINDKTAQTEYQVMREFVEMSINERAYKRLKVKIENAYELLNSIKKVLSRRIAEFELTKVQQSDIALQSGVDKRRPRTVGRSE